MDNIENNKLAELLFGNITQTPQDILAKYPKRNLDKKACVTRFAPSPTGYMHIGGLYVTLVCSRIAKQSNGVFYLRIEDTDKTREVEDGVNQIINALADYDIAFDEGPFGENNADVGAYGPYKQSLRREVYQTFAKELVRQGKAYPCFCSADELKKTVEMQRENKLDMGYYGEYATCRNLTYEQIEEKIKNGEEFALRLKSWGNSENKIVCKDLIRGNVEMPQNILDVILLKSDGIPTYHYAHAIDDFLMGTTHVIRGDEWISSYPIHQQLFEAEGFEMPLYAHIAPIMKQDGDSKRKLSKRKDPEASVSYYSAQGFPINSVIEYLLTIANSNYEEWRMKNPDADNSDFKLSLNKMPVSGALFDMDKLASISKDVISRMSEEELFSYISVWAKDFDHELNAFITKNPDNFKATIKLWKYNGKKVRKDIAKWSDLTEQYSYLYADGLEKAVPAYDFDPKLSKADINEFLTAYLDGYNHNTDNNGWFNDVKAIGEPLNYCPDIKAYKLSPDNFKGSVADACGIIRVAITGKRNSPDLFSIMQILGEDEVRARITAAIK